MTHPERLAKPDPIPTRPDEHWRVTVEPAMVVTSDPTVCSTRSCFRPAVAMTRRGETLVCADHLRESLMWIEADSRGRYRVVSWMLR